MEPNEIVKKLLEKHAGEQYVYWSCNVNCGGGSCIFKVGIKDGKIVSIEPDDRYPIREDSVLSIDDLTRNRVRSLPCEIALTWPAIINDPERIIYPLKRVGKRGEGKFQRITWDEALETIAREIKKCIEEGDPFSILTPYPESTHTDPIFAWIKPNIGAQGWGWCSFDPERLAKHLLWGQTGWETWPYHDIGDMLKHTKLILLFGAAFDVQRYGPGHLRAYYVKLARERGVPVIVLDPRLTATGAVLADQWIPIKPGTDMAFILAMTYILFKEDLYNHEFVEKWVESKGFEIWKNYVMGKEKGPDNPYGDGIPKTPEWAEKICGVPSETIYEITKLYVEKKPTFIWKNWSVARKSHGENVARAAAMLQCMTGYIAMPGGSTTLKMGDRGANLNMDGLRATVVSPPFFEFPPEEVPWPIPRLYRSHKWARAINLLDDVKSGKLTVEEYRRIIGWRADPNLPNPNPKVLFKSGYWGPSANFLVTTADSVKEMIKALEKMRLVIVINSHMNPTCKYADIILPMADNTFESGPMFGMNYGGFAQIALARGSIKPPGEALPWMLIMTKLAEKLGIAKQYFKYYSDEKNWAKDWERYMRDTWELVRETTQQEIKKYGGKLDKPIPTWEEFKEHPIFNYEEYYDETCHAFIDQIDREEGFPTESGKIEFCAFFLLDENLRGKRVHTDCFGRIYDEIPNDWRDLTAIPTYQPCVHGMEDPLIKEYPLMMLTPHSRYRLHSFGWRNKLLNGDVYRHAVWISAVDAKARGINDGDMVVVYNHGGEAIMPAYVTSRVSPGVCFVYHGAHFEFDASGRDKVGCATVFLGDIVSPLCAPHVTTCAQIKKVEK